jgi:exopolysaccharide biosynthesis polyprenyl glycosylphosphotransferase
MVLVAVTAVALRAGLGWFTQPLEVDDTFWAAWPLVLLTWIAAIAALGGYRERLFGSGADEYKILLHATAVAAGVTGVASFLARIPLSRSFYVLAFALGSVTLVLVRFALRRAVHHARRAGTLQHDVIIAGTPARIDEVARVLRKESWLGYRVLGALVPGATHEETPGGTPVLGPTAEVLQVLQDTGADVIFVAGGALDEPDQMRDLVYDLEQRDVHVVVTPSVTDVSSDRVRVRPVAGLPLIHVDPPRHLDASRRAKRAFDVVATLVVLTLAAPAMAAVAVAVKLHDGGPVFFRQTRTGRHGEEFRCWKFRTMVVDAEARLSALQRESGFDGGLFKLRRDPRVTGPGRLLRRLSLDELPQLFNVLRGDMSLVGPRPPLPVEVADYDRLESRRLRVRPGITGLWQVSGRSDLTWEESVRLDLYYVDNWSMTQDLMILVKTLGAVLRARGAY